MESALTAHLRQKRRHALRHEAGALERAHWQAEAFGPRNPRPRAKLYRRPMTHWRHAFAELFTDSALDVFAIASPSASTIVASAQDRESKRAMLPQAA